MRKELRYILPLVGLFTVPLLGQAGGEELYMKHCKKCHGEAGSGDTVMGKKFSIRDYTSAEGQAALTDEAIATAIKDGLVNEEGKKVMMPFGNKLSDEEVTEIVAYFRSLKKD